MIYLKNWGGGEMVSYNARTHEETALCFEFDSQSLHNHLIIKYRYM